MNETDLAGPMVFCLAFGATLLLYAGYDYSHQGRFVPADMMQPQQPYTGQIFQPTQAYTPTTPQPFYGNNFEDEPPLLE
ncbi:YIPF5, partial [Cervus elaphus hippelaphus]